MSTQEQSEAIVRIVSNRCRNLRKAIDRARALESAGTKGQALNDEQRESIRDLPRKEALLNELLEIHKKQAVLLEPPERESTKLSRRAAKAAKKARETKEGPDSSLDLRSEGEESTEKEREGNACDGEKRETEKTNGYKASADGASTDEKSNTHETALRDLSNEREALTKQVEYLKLSHERKVVEEKKDAVRKALNFFHVVDFLRQPGSREVLLSYYQTPQGKRSPRALEDLHMDLLCYFNVMLTSPNGNVPHDEAVDVSTAHCIEFLRSSDADAFEGTSYASLVEIANAIASCPILTERGGSTNGGKRRGRRDKIRNKMKSRAQETTGTGGESEPSLLVNDPTTNDDSR